MQSSHIKEGILKVWLCTHGDVFARYLRTADEVQAPRIEPITLDDTVQGIEDIPAGVRSITVFQHGVIKALYANAHAGNSNVNVGVELRGIKSTRIHF